MEKKKFDKQEFRYSVVYALKNQFRKTVEDATPQELYQAVAYAVKAMIVDQWIASRREYEKQDAKPFIICPWNSLWEGHWAIT